MAERLEALARADDATQHAAEVSDAPTRPRHLAEPPLELTPPLEPASLAELTPPLEPASLAELTPPLEPASLAVPPKGPWPAAQVPPTAQVVHAPDQTGRLEVPVPLAGPSSPPPPRNTALPVPPGVTLLRDNLSLPLGDPPALDEQPGIDDLELDEAPDELDEAPDELDEAPDELDDDPDLGGSSAATIADLLRHGGSGLFFQR